MPTAPDPPSERDAPMRVSGEAVRAIGVRLSALMLGLGVVASLVSLMPVWIAPSVHGQGIFLLFYCLAAWLTVVGGIGLAWYLWRGVPPVSWLWVGIVGTSLGLAIVSVRPAIAALRARELRSVNALYGPVVAMLRDHAEVGDAALRAAIAHDELHVLRIYRGPVGDRRAVLVTGGGSIDLDGTTLVLAIDAQGRVGTWERVENNGEERRAVAAKVAQLREGPAQ